MTARPAQARHAGAEHTDRRRPEVAAWLAAFVRSHGGVAGSVHLASGEGLALVAAHNLPASVRAATTVVPYGKGMAGQALARREPVQTCNLRTDDSGDVQPGARAVDAGAAVALPVIGAGGTVEAVVGIAFGTERDLPAGEVARLLADAATVAGARPLDP